MEPRRGSRDNWRCSGLFFSNVVTALNWPCEEWMHCGRQGCAELPDHPVPHHSEAVFDEALRVGRTEHGWRAAVEACGGKGCSHADHRKEWDLTQVQKSKTESNHSGKIHLIHKKKLYLISVKPPETKDCCVFIMLSEGHWRFSYTFGKGGVRKEVFNWLQAATSPLDVTKSYTLINEIHKDLWCKCIFQTAHKELERPSKAFPNLLWQFIN